MKNQSRLIGKVGSVGWLALGIAQPTLLANPDYENILVQTQMDSGVVHVLSGLDPQGEGSAPLPLEPNGAIFEVRSIHLPTNNIFVLDQKYVGAYVGNIEIVTLDPYPHTPRTRVDKPFSVRVTTNGILSSSANPSERELRMAWNGEHYSAAEPSFPANFEPDFSRSEEIASLTENRQHTYNFNVTNLSGADITRIAGEEFFSLWTLPSENVPSQLVDLQNVQIWPMARAEFGGFETGAGGQLVPQNRFTNPITVDIYDLYPDSEYWIRIYPGTTSTPDNTTIISSGRVSDSIPRNAPVRFDSFGNFIPANGTYTLEVVTQAVVDNAPISVNSITFQVQRSLNVRGSIHSR